MVPLWLYHEQVQADSVSSKKIAITISLDTSKSCHWVLYGSSERSCGGGGKDGVEEIG